MKSIKEKQLLVKLAMSLGQQADPGLVKEISSFNAIKQDAHESIKKNALKDLTEAFKKANLEKEVKEIIEYPVPPTLDEVLTILKEEEPLNELVQPQTEEEPSAKEDSISSSESSLAERAAKFISEAPRDSFQQPQPDPVEKNFKDIQAKIKFLESTIGKIAIAGPGSGETKFRMLDDIDRASIGNTDQVLRWRPDARGDAYGKFFFGQLSGNQGPIQSMLYTPTQTLYSGNVTRQAGLTYYDSREDTFEIIHADGAATYTGQDNYIRVYNNYGANLTKGTFVQFSGAFEDIITCIPFVNNENASGLYSIGLLATDISANTIGRAKLLGEIRDVDTSGSSVGETWQLGDILWSNPKQPGTLTNVKPTAPNIVISVAAVLKASVTNGILFARPTVWPRLRYGDFFSASSQVASSPNQDTKIHIANVLIASGFSVSGNSIIALESGLFKFNTRLQLTSSSSSQKSFVVWYKRNGINLPYSAVRQSISDNGGYNILTNLQVISMNALDNVSIHFAVTDTSLSINSPQIFGGASDIPAVQITVTEAAL